MDPYEPESLQGNNKGWFVSLSSTSPFRTEHSSCFFASQAYLTTKQIVAGVRRQFADGL
jgi:hypothetical protein